MSICEKCMHNKVCGAEGAFDEGLTYCRDFLGGISVQNIIEESEDKINSKSLCDSCITDRCIFQSGIVRNHCDFYKSERKFKEIVVEYPPAELCTYTEYIGKPYFSIKYEENGEHIIGYGTYKPEVLSMYLREYFIETESER